MQGRVNVEFEATPVRGLLKQGAKAVRDGLQAGTGYNGDCLQTNTAIAINCL